jgi:hypothetical protein
LEDSGLQSSHPTVKESQQFERLGTGTLCEDLLSGFLDLLKPVGALDFLGGEGPTPVVSVLCKSHGLQPEPGLGLEGKPS